MKKMIEMMKIGDLIIIGFLVIFSFLPLALFTSNQSQAANADDEVYMVVSVDGEELHRMELKNDYIRESYLYENEAGHMNLVVRDGEKVYMQNANCPDALCVQEGEITKVGETIVCLPHRLLVEIVSENPDIQDQGDIDIFS